VADELVKELSETGELDKGKDAVSNTPILKATSI